MNSLKNPGDRTVLEFFSSLNFLLEGGLRLEEALEIMGKMEGRSVLSRMSREAGRFVKRGESFSDVILAGLPGMKSLYILLLRAGEITGRLREGVSIITGLLEARIKMRENFLRALAYPAFILLLMTAGMFFLSWFILPSVVENTANLGILDESEAAGLYLSIRRFWLILRIVSAGCAALPLLFLFSRRRKRNGCSPLDNLLFKLIRPLVINREIYGFLAALEILLAGGLPLGEGMKELETVFINPVLRLNYQDILTAMDEGEDPGDLFSQSKVFPSRMGMWIRYSRESGNLLQAVGQLRGHFQGLLTQSHKSIAAAVEPALILFVGALLFTFVLTIIVPFFSLVNRGLL